MNQSIIELKGLKMLSFKLKVQKCEEKPWSGTFTPVY